MTVADKANEIKNAVATITGVSLPQVSIILDHLGLTKSLEHREKVGAVSDSYGISNPSTWRLDHVTGISTRIATSTVAM